MSKTPQKPDLIQFQTPAFEEQIKPQDPITPTLAPQKRFLSSIEESKAKSGTSSNYELMSLLQSKKKPRSSNRQFMKMVDR